MWEGRGYFREAGRERWIWGREGGGQAAGIGPLKWKVKATVDIVLSD